MSQAHSQAHTLHIACPSWMWTTARSWGGIKNCPGRGVHLGPFESFKHSVGLDIYLSHCKLLSRAEMCLFRASDRVSLHSPPLHACTCSGHLLQPVHAAEQCTSAVTCKRLCRSAELHPGKSATTPGGSPAPRLACTPCRVPSHTAMSPSCCRNWTVALTSAPSFCALQIDLVQCSVTQLLQAEACSPHLSASVVIMNPPFGTRTKGADIQFLRAAFKVGLVCCLGSPA